MVDRRKIRKPLQGVCRVKIGLNESITMYGRTTVLCITVLVVLVLLYNLKLSVRYIHFPSPTFVVDPVPRSIIHVPCGTQHHWSFSNVSTVEKFQIGAPKIRTKKGERSHCHFNLIEFQKIAADKTKGMPVCHIIMLWCWYFYSTS